MTMENEKTQRQMIQETHDSMIRLETKLPFMSKDIEDNEEAISDLGKSHGRLKRNFWLLIGVLVGSGVIAGGVFGAISA